jgi:hypothetical protein
MWPRVACVLIVGYLGMSRAFAYVGIPAWKLFIGEVVLVFLLLLGPKTRGRPWLWVASKLLGLKRLLTWYGLFLGYGIFQVLRGIEQGNPPLVAVRDLAFNYYPLYFFLGLWAGLTRPDLLPRLIRSFAWFNAIYGMLFILFLSRVEWYVPGVSAEIGDVPVFGQPIYSFVALLGLLAYEKDFSRSWYLWVLNGCVMLGMQFRTEWLAFALGLVIWCVLTRQGKRVLQVGAVMASLLALMYVTDFRLPSPEGRSEYDISARQMVDRVLAPFRADVADVKTAAGSGGVDSQEATFVFRTVWWLAIWDSAHSSFQTAVLGHGYGFPLGDLVPYIEGSFIRTPHNTFFYALGYTGWIGVLLFALFQSAIFRLLWLAYRSSGDPFGIIYWVSMLTFSMALPLVETPYGAIPLYLVLGWCASPALLSEKSSERRTTQHLAARFTDINPNGATEAAS